MSIALGGRSVVRGGDITVRLLLAAAAEGVEEVVLLDDLVLRRRVVAELGQAPQLLAAAATPTAVAVTVPLRRRGHRRRGRGDIGFCDRGRIVRLLADISSMRNYNQNLETLKLNDTNFLNLKV